MIANAQDTKGRRSIAPLVERVVTVAAQGRTMDLDSERGEIIVGEQKWGQGPCDDEAAAGRGFQQSSGASLGLRTALVGRVVRPPATRYHALAAAAPTRMSRMNSVALDHSVYGPAIGAGPDMTCVDWVVQLRKLSPLRGVAQPG